MCKRGDAFSLAVLIDRGLDQIKSGLITVMECSRACFPAPFPNHFFGLLLSFNFIQFSGYYRWNIAYNLYGVNYIK